MYLVIVASVYMFVVVKSPELCSDRCNLKAQEICSNFDFYVYSQASSTITEGHQTVKQPWNRCNRAH